MNLLDYIYMAAVKIDTSDINYNPTATDNNALSSVLNTAYFWATVLAVIVIVIAGFFFTLSRDDPNQVARARNAILYAIIGLAVVFTAFIITNFVLEAL